MTATKKHQQEKQFCFLFFVLMLIVMLACNSTTAFSSIQVAAPWGSTTMPSWESSWGTTSSYWSATTKTEGQQATSTTLFGWSVPTSVWALEADPTARKVVYYDDVPSFSYSTPGDEWLTADDETNDAPTPRTTRWFQRGKDKL